MPVWILAMAGYRIGLYSRTALKQFGMKMMLGPVDVRRLRQLGGDYARGRISAPGLMPGTMKLLDEDRAAGARLMIATAAFDFYAASFADRLGFEALVATRWNGSAIPGGNCYGMTKKDRVLDWFANEGIDRSDCTVRFVSDSFADGPMLDWSDDPIFATGSHREAAQAKARGWRVIDPCAALPVAAG